MKQNFTPNHLVKYLYRETTASETLAINEALNENFGLREEFEGLFQAYQQLPKVTFSPSPSAIQRILGYSERQTLERLA
ncbi:MAG: hypothetical protein DHS20C18_05160 [Saprospiraceae bacterium]|nr:MAG: hypothetical protein DHS20C18_05160 [Saprospiraceae bacterium]